MATQRDPYGPLERGDAGLTVEQVLGPNYLTRRTNRGGEEAETIEQIKLDPTDPEGSFLRETGIDIRTALKDVAPGFNPGSGAIGLDTIVPDAAIRAPAKGEGIGAILSIAATVAGFAIGIPPQITAAFKFVASGGENVLGSVASAFGGFGELFGGVAEAAGATGAAADFSAAMEATADLGSAASDALSGAATGVTSSPTDTLFNNGPIQVASAGVSDVPQGLTGTVSGPAPAAWTPTPGETGAFDMGQFAPQDVGLDPSKLAGGPNTGNGSWLDNLLKDPKSQLGLIGGAMTVAGSTLAGAARNKSAEDIAERNRQAALSIEDRRAENQRALAEQQQLNAQEQADWQRKFQQAGNMAGATQRVSANQTAQLRRPDGTPVYSSGLIASRMGA